MKSYFYSIIISVFLILITNLIFSSHLSAKTQESEKLYSLPVKEIEQILSHWLDHYGFSVSKTSLANRQVKLVALKKNESLKFMIKPYSPLSTNILVTYSQSGFSDKIMLKKLWIYLDNYSSSTFLETTISQAKIPASVLSHKDFVICITVLINDELIQFSGFILDKKGLIISTAHDLTDAKEIRIALNNGRKLIGRLVKINMDRDLVLIKIDLKFKSSILLTQNRNLLKDGEQIYSMGCPLNQQGIMNYGTISRPISQMNNLPLYLVNMDILPGSSGSPVFDAHGNLIGIVKGRYRGRNSVGFIIPLKTVIEFLDNKQ